MALMDVVKGLFGGGKKRLDSITPEELRRERIRLEQVEQRIGKEIDDLESRKKELFAKGKDESSQRQQIAMARKIKELDAGAQARDRQLAMVSKQMRILSGLSILKENQSMMKEMGVSSIISKMDVVELQAYVEKATVEGQFQMERFAEILKAMEGPEGAELAGEDSDTLAIVAAMQEAKMAESGDVGEAAAVKTGLNKVDDILRNKEAAPEAQKEQDKV